ncbi:MAG: cell division protein FtsQ/DivIB, partial [Solirubrobacteraceae bacterium]
MSSGTWTRHDHRLAPARPRLLPRRLLSPQTLIVLAVLALLGWGAWTWYGNSSLVRVQSVRVSGLSGPDVPQIRGALTRAGLTMSTLNVNMGRLDAAVERYPQVHALTVTALGRHGLRIGVVEQVPVALVEVGGQAVVVDDQGRLLPQTTVVHGLLPMLTLPAPPAGRSVTGAGELAALSVLGAAPAALLAHVQSAGHSAAHGVIVQLRAGPAVYFGPASQPAAKWAALIGVLQNSGAAGATYIDVSDPERPAAGASTASGSNASDASNASNTATTA